VRALIGALGSRLQSGDYALGCPVATTALEQSADSPRLRAGAQAAFARWLELLRARLQADGRDPAIAEEQALFVLSAIEGALLLARTSRSTRPLRVVAQQLAAHLQSTARG
jgi:TetR/AcrR family transcriptional repressor of lmrAB and yxaGH operons